MISLGDYITLAVAFGMTIIFVYGYFRQKTTADRTAYLKTWAELAQQLAPAVLKLIPAIKPALIPVITKAIVQVEDFASSTTTGQEKKDLVLDIIVGGLQATNIQAGREVVNIDQTVAAVSKGIDITVAVVNASHKTV